MANYIWPTPGYDTITSGVGSRWDSVHKGIDISAPNGARVVATDGGKVIDVVSTCTHNYGKSQSEMKSDTCGGGYGNRVYIQHSNGQVSRYAHLSAVSVKVGDTVSQGQTIGAVGSTGQSTGFHLHFEIRDSSSSSASYLDPEKYVSPSNSIIIDDTIPIISDNTAMDSFNNQVYSISGMTTGMSTTDSRDKALYAFFKLSLGGYSLEIAAGRERPNIYQSMEINRILNGSSSVQFVLFDDDWIKLEKLLVDNYEDIRLIYGWQNGKQSKEFKLRITTYSVDLYDTGVVLKIEAISEEAYTNLDPVKGYDTETKNPTEAIKKICEQIGCTVDDSNFVETVTLDDRESDFMLLNDNPISYIVDEIIPQAKSTNDKSLAFYVDPGDEKVAHLVEKTVDTANIYGAKTYFYQKGYNSVVESISFDIGGMFGGTTRLGIASTSVGVHIDRSEKSEESKVHDQESVNSDVVTSQDDTALTIKTGQSKAVENYSRDSKIQIDNKVYYGLINSSSEQYKATMTIVGDPEINILDTVNIIIMTDDYQLYHTSGTYMVLKVMDTIENGTYKTTLELGAHHNFSESGIIIGY